MNWVYYALMRYAPDSFNSWLHGRSSPFRAWWGPR